MWPIILSGAALALAAVALIFSLAALFMAKDYRRSLAELETAIDDVGSTPRNLEEAWRGKVL